MKKMLLALGLVFMLAMACGRSEADAIKDQMNQMDARNGHISIDNSQNQQPNE